MRDKRGITLIALVVTIIVLLILAGVTISLVLNQNGIFSKAQLAKDQTTKEDVLERVKMAVITIKTNHLGNIKDKQGNLLITKTELENEIAGDKIIQDAQAPDFCEVIINGVTVIVSNDLEVRFKDQGSAVEKVVDLNQVAQVGDYVDYSVEYDNATDGLGGTETLKGWRIFSIDENTGTVKIISAGVPMVYNPNWNGTAGEYDLIQGFKDTFFPNTSGGSQTIQGITMIDSNYAQDVASVTKMEIEQLTPAQQQSDLIKMNTMYWLGQAVDANYVWYMLDGSMSDFYELGNYNYDMGVRPVVTLKTETKVQEQQGTDAYGNNAWIFK